MTTTTFAETIRRMELLVANLVPVLDEIPQIQDKHTALNDMLVRAKRLDDGEEQLRGQLREATALRLELTAEGARIRRELTAVLQAHFGFDNERLIQFGIRPQPKSRRKAAARVRDGANSAVAAAADAGGEANSSES
ncbi:MAG TPA: hypothetical protein VN783_01210 [Thermoanaerobaculia bacterium]|nr:hypothetical protein [Thermoanaerobaculia bacterium]